MASMKEQNIIEPAADQVIDKGEDKQKKTTHSDSKEQPGNDNDDGDNINKIDPKIIKYKDIIERKLRDDPEWASAHFSLGCIYKDSFNRSRNAHDLGLALEHMKLAVHNVQNGCPDLPKWQDSLAEIYRSQYQQTFDLRDIEQALKYQKEATENIPTDYPDIARYQYNLGLSHHLKYNKFGDQDDLEKAYRNFTEALVNTVSGDSHLPMLQSSLGTTHQSRYVRYGHAEDLEASLKLTEEAIFNTPAGHPSLSIMQSSLGSIYRSKYERYGDFLDLDLALKYTEEAVINAQVGHSDISKWQNNLGSTYQYRYQNLGNSEDLEAALKYHKEAVINAPAGHPGLPMRLGNLGIAHHSRYEKHGDLGDLNAALKYHNQAVMSAPAGHSSLPKWQNSLGLAYLAKYERLGNLDDLEAALKYMKKSVMNTPDRHPYLSIWYNNLGKVYGSKYERYGNLDDLDSALKYLKEAVTNAVPGYIDLPKWKHNLGAIYHRRYQRYGDFGDLDTALKYHEEAVRNVPAKYPYLPIWQNGLGAVYLSKYERHGNMEDLEVALKYMNKAVTSAGHYQSHHLKNSLGSTYQIKYERQGNLEDLEAALKYKKAAVMTLSSEHPSLVYCLNSLVITYQWKYKSQGTLEDLEIALKHGENAIMKTPIGGPELSICHNTLGNSYQLRYEYSGDIKDLDMALHYFQLSAEGTSTPASILLQNSIRWAVVAHSQQKMKMAMSAYMKAFELLPCAVWLGIHFEDRQYALKQARSLVVDAAACCIHNNEPIRAVEFLEHGRFVLFSQLLQLRNGFDELQAAAPDLHSELCQISKSLEIAGHITSLHSSRSYQASNNQKNFETVELGKKWDQLLSAVRNLPGFSNFLKPEPFSELCLNVRYGTVIFLNCSQFRCDALVIQSLSANVQIVPLSSMSFQRAIDMRLHLASMGVNFCDNSYECLDGKNEPYLLDLEEVLDDLYSRVISPVISCIQDLKITSNHIWWCPTGAFTGLPFHAALIHGEAVSGKISSYISSYTPTLKLLMLKSHKPPKPIEDLKVLAVAISHTNGQCSLPQTLVEIECITKVVNSGGQVLFIDGQVSKKSIMENLPLCDWAHFSCHGVQDSDDPLRSGLIMPDGERLELSEILKLNLPNARLIFLSACQTGLGDIQLFDEALHMAGGFIFAGFQGAIATLWSIDDQDGPVIAKEVYSFLTDSGKNPVPDASKAAEALHHAVVKLRAQGVPAHHWASFIHMGI